MDSRTRTTNHRLRPCRRRSYGGQIAGRRLRTLLNDPDIDSITADADVSADGITSGVTGAAANTSYSLRSTLGLMAYAQTAGAVALAHALNPTLAVNSNWLVTSVAENTTIDGQNSVWGDNVVWGDVHLQP